MAFGRAAKILLAPVRWPLTKWTRSAEQVPALEQTAWQRAEADTSTLAQNRPIWFGIIVTPPAGALAVVVAAWASQFSLVPQLVLGAVGALVGFLVGVSVLALALLVSAPWRQRDEARGAVTEESERAEKAEFLAESLRDEIKIAAEEIKGRDREIARLRELEPAHTNTEQDARLQRELGDLILEGDSLRAELPDPGGDEVMIVRARLEWLPRVEEYAQRSWAWIERNRPEQLGLLTPWRDKPHEQSALRAMPPFMDRRIADLRSILEKWAS